MKGQMINMKIAFIGDSHLGYFRFEKDAHVQAKRAFLDASEKADLIVHVGDLFDTRIPKLNTLDKAIEILKIPVEKGIPTYLIHGNHDRRGKGLTNALTVLSNVKLIRYINNEIAYIKDKRNDEKIGILGIGNVPDDYAPEVIEKVIQIKGKPKNVNFSILIMHQTVTEFVHGIRNTLSIFDLEKYGFDLIVNGHIHKFHSALDGKFLIPGSTVLTQLKEDELGAKGYILYNTESRSYEFIPIKVRDFKYKKLVFENAGLEEVISKINKTISELIRNTDFSPGNEPVVKIKLMGTLASGINSSDIHINVPDWISIDNLINENIIDGQIKHIRNIRDRSESLDDVMLSRIREKARNKIKSFDPAKIFELLISDPKKAREMMDIN